ncbi:MAG: hypothetical protein MUO64_17480 [Anaerolineales bacterium]|nr:hypothetical protein [Anaerolineales bacterium]
MTFMKSPDMSLRGRFAPEAISHLAWQEIAAPGGASTPTVAKTCPLFCVLHALYYILNDMQPNGKDHPLMSLRGGICRQSNLPYRLAGDCCAHFVRSQ